MQRACLAPSGVFDPTSVADRNDRCKPGRRRELREHLMRGKHLLRRYYTQSAKSLQTPSQQMTSAQHAGPEPHVVPWIPQPPASVPPVPPVPPAPPAPPAPPPSVSGLICSTH